MLVLGIETATPSGGIALLEDDTLLAQQTIRSSRAHSRLIVPTLRQMLKELRRSIDDIDIVAVGAGPGSFTGVRVGMSIAKGLCEGGRPQLVAVSSLEALALRAWDGGPGCVVPLLSARQGEVYGGIFRLNDNCELQCDGQEFCTSPQKALSSVSGPVLVAGEAAFEFAEVWRSAPNVDLRFARADRSLCSPDTVALIGMKRALAGEFSDVSGAGPVYLRLPSTSTPKKRRP
ncbi:tRNA (adenosine(37)-N6)-threonylcarbamoyltransferase complex dimerization subunit type 1 TsaB [bacterium]|nr:tRNA (adenosine(37)-N6)-threonylcarbamoyltransferase complex dimerization subunit type 1 TsaB [bacterium]